MLRTGMFLLVVVHLLSIATYAQTNLSSKQVERLADACKLWGHIRYFHPYFQDRNIPWDSAFTAAVPHIIAATSRQDYERAIGNWLAVLNDPVTRVTQPVQQAVEFSKQDPSPVIRLKDSTIFITVKNLKDLDDYERAGEKFEQLQKLLPQANSFVFDLRPDLPLAENTGLLDLHFSYFGVEPLLTNASLQKPGLRTIAHDGFVPERGGSSGGYSNYVRMENSQIIRPGTTRYRPVVFLVNEHIAVPAIAFALRDAGKATIVSEGAFNQSLSGTTLRFTIADSLVITMRTGQLTTEKGLVSLLPDLQLKKEKADSVNLYKALTLLRQDKEKPASSSSLSTTFVQPDTYPSNLYPGLGYRMLAAAKIYTVINYFYPNKKLMDRSWDSVLIEHLPRFAAASDSMEYALAVHRMYANIQDGHGFVNGRVQWWSKFSGPDASSFYAKVIGGKVVVTSLINDSAAQKEGIAVGDVILQINGRNAMDMLDEMRPYMAASNKAAQDTYLSIYLTTGKDSSTARLLIETKQGARKELDITYRKAFNRSFWIKRRTLNQGPVFKLLDLQTGYIDMQRLQSSAVDSMFDAFKNTTAIIMDMRGYPQGTAWQIAPRLTEKNQVEAALFTRVVATSPLVVSDREEVQPSTLYTFLQKIPSTTKWRYKGKTVMLINAETQSQAEHSGLFYKAANGTVFIGSQTAGANGDVTNFFIPGGINLTFSGQNVSYPNGQTMQRRGLVPDIEAKPTIKGIQQGRDEVLERAVQYLKTGK